MAALSPDFPCNIVPDRRHRCHSPSVGFSRGLPGSTEAYTVPFCGRALYQRRRKRSCRSAQATGSSCQSVLDKLCRGSKPPCQSMTCRTIRHDPHAALGPIGRRRVGQRLPPLPPGARRSQHSTWRRQLKKPRRPSPDPAPQAKEMPRRS